MFSISSQKAIITLQRSLILKKDGVLPSGKLDCLARLDTGLDLKSPDGRAIVSKFDTLFNQKITGKAKKQDDRIAKVRAQLAKWVHLGESENKLKQYADTQQEDIIRDWNRFMRVDIKRAASEALEDAIKALKKPKIDPKALKLKFSNTDLQDNKMEFLTGVLDIPGRGAKGRVASAGMMTLVTGMQKLGSPISTLRSGWERNEKLLKQGVQDANAMQKNLSAMRKAAESMNTRLARMKKISEGSNKISAQSLKGVDIVMAALAKHQKTARLNDQDKVVIMANKALTALNGARKTGKETMVDAQSAKLEATLDSISRLLKEAENLSQNNLESLARTARANSKASLSAKSGEDAVAAALKELKLQAKI